MRELNVSYNDIGDNGISMITEWLLSNRSLTKLDVSRCNLSEKGTVVYSYSYTNTIDIAGMFCHGVNLSKYH